jgi:hypothetical protein
MLKINILKVFLTAAKALAQWEKLINLKTGL